MSQTSKPSEAAATSWLSKLRGLIARSNSAFRPSLGGQSIARRLVILSLIIIGLAFLVGGVLLSRLFYWHAITTTERDLEEILSNISLDVSIQEDGQGRPLVSLNRSGQETAFNSPFSGKYWQVTEPDGTLHRSDSLLDFALQAPPGLRPGQVLRDVRPGPDEQTILQSHKAVFYRDYGLLLHLSAAVDISETRELHRSFNLYLAGALVVLAIVLLGGILLQVTLALRPLRQAERDLQQVRLGEQAEMRQDYPNEIGALVKEINALVDDNHRIVERARKQVGNLAHGLKTPLSVLKNEAENADVSPQMLRETVGSEVEAIQTQVQRYLALARSAAASQQRGVQTNVSQVVGPLVRTLGKIYRDKGLLITMQVPAELTFAGEHQDLQEMLGNLLDNACKWAGSEVEVTAKREDTALIIQIDDDGPGVPEAQRAELGKRGKRLDEQTPGTGLGLSIVTDMADVYKGQLVFEKSGLGGLSARLVFELD